MQARKKNQEVLFAINEIVKVGYRDIKFLKEKAQRNQRKRIRFCAHKSVNETLHEMFIVHKKGAYIRPHKHLNKPESFHLIRGAADVIIFNRTGKITGVIPVGEYASRGNFYYRISQPYYHTLLIKSDFLVFHETTNGPFKKSGTVFAAWSPDEKDGVSQKEFMRHLEKAVREFLIRKKNE